MINKIGNWVFGSFFRTIGRLLVFILLGVIISNLVDFGSLIDNFRITDLFFEKVDAAVLTETVKNKGTSYLRTVQSGWTNTDGFYETTVQSSANEIVKTLTFDYDIGATQHDYIQINITASNANASSVNQSSTVTGGDVCTRWKWRTIDSFNNVIEWGCDRVSTNPDSTINDREYIQNLLSGYNFMATINYQGGWAACTFQDNAVFCPTNKSQVNSIDFHIMYNSNYSSSFNLGVHRSFVFYDYDTTGETIIQQQQATNNAINNQTQQQQQQHQELMDDNTTEADSEGQDFINNFSNNSHGLTGIITAPLSAIQSLSSSTCSPLVLPLPFMSNKSLTLPCMNSIYTQHFGAFYTMYQGIILALISYWVCVRLFTLVKGFKDPEDDKIEVMDL